jgi:hypothetical protein
MNDKVGIGSTIARRSSCSPRRIASAPKPWNPRSDRSNALSECIVGIENTDKLTDPQIVAKVKEHYRIDR